MIISITFTAIQFVKIIARRSKSANHIQTPVNPHDSTETLEWVWWADFSTTTWSFKNKITPLSYWFEALRALRTCQGQGWIGVRSWMCGCLVTYFCCCQITWSKPYIIILFIYQFSPNLSPRDHFVYAPSQWETTLQCDVISHWLDAYIKWSLLTTDIP